MTVQELMPLVRSLLPRRSAGTYSTGLQILEDRLGHAAVDEVTVAQLRLLRDEVQAASGAHIVRRATSRNRLLRSYDPTAFGQGAAANFVTSTRFFFQVALGEHLVQRSPADGLQTPRRHPSVRRPLTSDELETIWHVATTTGMDPELDAKMLTFLRHTACRRSGLLALRLGHLDPVHERLTLTEKYGESRSLPLRRGVIDDLIAFAAARGAAGSTDPVFRYRSGAPLTRRRFNSLFDRIDRHTDFTEVMDVSAHWIRHTTLADIAAASDVRVAAAFAGHSPGSLGVIGRYTKVTFDDLRAAYEAVFGDD